MKAAFESRSFLPERTFERSSNLRHEQTAKLPDIGHPHAHKVAASREVLPGRQDLQKGERQGVSPPCPSSPHFRRGHDHQYIPVNPGARRLSAAALLGRLTPFRSPFLLRSLHSRRVAT